MPKLLLIDDDTVTIELLTLVFRRKGFDIRVAFSGEQALTIASIWSPDAVLLDVGLPGLSANDVCISLRASLSTAHIPILVFSGSTYTEARAAVPGATAYLHKPINLLEVASLLLKLIGERAAPV